MNRLIHDPIGDMWGPAFLAVYALVIVAVCVAAYRAMGARDWTRWEEPPPVPKAPDPYGFAYLRGGVNEVIRTVLFSLMQRGYVAISADPKKKWYSPTVPKFRQVADHPDATVLSPIERELFETCANPLAGHEFFQAEARVAALEAGCASYKKQFEAEDLLLPLEVKRAAWPTWLLGAFVLVGLSAYKITVALSRGRPNVQFLFILTIVGLFALMGVTAFWSHRKMSAKGRAYLDRLRLAFADLKDEPTRQAHPALAYDAATVLMLGLFGVASLKGTSYKAFTDIFATAATGSGGACGGGCGGGGGGCGGGCGGCGG